MNAPEFPTGLQWLNTDAPLSLEALRGKVVLLDFWTYCCINCMHIIPDLKRLENEFVEELVVIGVHSAKFSQEKDTENIRQAILRYEIKHPVVNDNEFRIWRSFGARAWPTVVMIAPDGRIAMTVSGEGIYHRFSEPIKHLIREYDKLGKLDRRPLKLRPEVRKYGGFLNFPGKVAVDNTTGTAFISDQNHNRIVVASLADGSVKDVIGAGAQGLRDGDFDSALFNHPQGIVPAGDLLYIADTDNHAVRVANLTDRSVSTLAGTGRQAGLFVQAGRGIDTPLNSPWDLAILDSIMFVAMAGSHQIWTIRLADGWTAPFAGTGQEGLRDGVRTKAWLAQPSGLTVVGDRLYFVDSEVSAVRFVDLSTVDGRVETIVGRDLFEFGDVDGADLNVRLQHPLGITSDGRLLYVADTYNNKIKVIDPADRTSTTLIGDGEAGSRDGKWSRARFYEPGGVQYVDGKLYISDTNNHLIRIADLAARDVKTLDISAAPRASFRGDTLSARRVQPGGGMIQVALKLPAGTKFTPDSKVVFNLRNGGKVARLTGDSELALPSGGAQPFNIPVEWRKGEGIVEVQLHFMYCSERDANVCWPGFKVVALPVEVTEEAQGSAIVLELSAE